MHENDLFDYASKQDPSSKPLAERLRPKKLDDILGQDHIVGSGKVLRRAIEADKIPSMVLWGPPGTGKTTLARIVATTTGAEFIPFSAVLGGVKEIRTIVEGAERRLKERSKKTILFVDEIHRFNKSQQDALLPHVESGTLTFIGATTENPSFEVNAALLSRSRVFTLKPLEVEDLLSVVDRGLALVGLQADTDVRNHIASQADGDARRALNAVELSSDVAKAAGANKLDMLTVQEATSGTIRHDKGGDSHYDVVSAFIKSMRGSDPDAALYWMVRMLDAGEPPRFILRRMIIFAAEDIGNADPKALSIAMDAASAFERVGLPEGAIPISMAVAYLASAPKSNAAYKALAAAREDVKNFGSLPVPMFIRNAPTDLLAKIGAGKNYRYPHDEPGGFVATDYLPEKLIGRTYYNPTTYGDEKAIFDRVQRLRKAVMDAREASEQQ